MSTQRKLTVGLSKAITRAEPSKPSRVANVECNVCSPLKGKVHLVQRSNHVGTMWLGLISPQHYDGQNSEKYQTYRSNQNHIFCKYLNHVLEVSSCVKTFVLIV